MFYLERETTLTPNSRQEKLPARRLVFIALILYGGILACEAGSLEDDEGLFRQAPVYSNQTKTAAAAETNWSVTQTALIKEWQTQQAATSAALQTEAAATRAEATPTLP